MTDDEILDTIDRRFAAVESRLPPTPVARLGNRPVREATIAGGALRAAPVPVVVVVAGLVAAGLVLRPSDRLPSSGAVASPSAASIVAPPPAVSAPSASNEPLLVLHGASGGDSLLIEHFHWGPTMCGSDGSYVGLDGAAVDRAVNQAGRDEGWVDVPLALARQPATVRVWVGRAPESAAIAYGSPILAIGSRGDTWIVLDGRGREMVALPTPKGRTFWILTGSIADGGCGASQP
jgi:hypothetical protein